MTDRLADNELSFTHPPGWEDLTDEQKKQEAEKAIEAAHNGIRVEANSIASFAVASTVEQSLNKSGKKIAS